MQSLLQFCQLAKNPFRNKHKKKRLKYKDIDKYKTSTLPSSDKTTTVSHVVNLKDLQNKTVVVFFSCVRQVCDCETIF